MTFLIGLLLLILAVVGAVSLVAMQNKRAFTTQNEIAAGTKSRAPAAWAGAHTPEALLHRRLRTAVDGARAQVGGVGSGLDDVVAAIARGAQEIDDRLIAAAALPASGRGAAVAALEPSVAALENAVVGLGSSASNATAAGSAITSAVADAHQRLDALNEALVEVNAADVTERTIAQPPLTQPPTPLSQPPMQPPVQPLTGPSGEV